MSSRLPYSPKVASNADSEVSSGSSPASVGLSSIYVNSKFSGSDEVSGIVAAYREHCYKLEHSPYAFLHLKNKQDGSTALFRVNACSASRYFPQGRTRIVQDIRQRLDGTQKRGVFFHLTVDAKKYTLPEIWPSMWPQFNRFKTCLNYYRKCHMNAPHAFRYGSALEPHKKSDFPHMHVYCPELRWLVKKPDLPKMDEWWGMGSVKTEKELRRDSARNYITKYISKLDGWSEVSLAMMWRYRIRIYNLSHQYRKDKPDAKWERLGRYTDPKSLAKGLNMERKDAEALVEAFADIDDNLIYLTIPEQSADGGVSS